MCDCLLVKQRSAMGGSEDLADLSRPQPTHPTKYKYPQHYSNKSAQNNNAKTSLLGKHPIPYNGFKQTYGHAITNTNTNIISADGSMQNYTPNCERNYYPAMRASRRHVVLDFSSMSFPSNEKPPESASVVEFSSKIDSNIAVIEEQYDQPLQRKQLDEAFTYQSAFPLSAGRQIIPSQQHPMTCDHQGLAPYRMATSRHPALRNFSANGDVYLRHTHNHYDSTSRFQHELNVESLGPEVPSPMTNPERYYRHGPNCVCPVTSSRKNQSYLSHDYFYRTMKQLVKPKRLVDYNNEIIRRIARSFVDAFCPLLGEKPYCLPPIRRYSHTDKQLVLGMESENRVLGSFERFFAENQLPAFMLCHYPTSGFMQVYQGKEDRRSGTSSNRRNTVTLLLLSNVFSVTIVTISIISGSSEFVYILKSVQKAAMHMKRCSTIVSQWLTSLGVRPNVKEIIAFPNLKRTVMQRIDKDKEFHHMFSSLCTLHVDDLSPPLEEELSTQAYCFNKWMEKYVLCHGPTLSKEELRLVVGALLSPRLSQVDFVHEEKPIVPITEATSYSTTLKSTVEDVSQLKLTIDGVTKPFDVFMDEYVSSYYPNVEHQTYRVPPIHFNIQSFKKPSELNLLNGSSDKEVSEVPTSEESYILSGNSSNHFKENLFMPPCHTSTISVRRNSNSIDNAHKMEFDNVPCENDPCNDLQMGESNNIIADVEISTEHINEPKETVLESESLERSSDNQTLTSMISFTPESNERSLTASAQAVPTVISPPPSSHFNSYNSRKLPSSTSSMNRSTISAQLEALQDVDVLSEVMAKDVRADEGENRVISALEVLGRKIHPMFIICGYQYNNYLNKLREEMFSKEEAKRPVRAFGQLMRAEHDCLIFHKKYGAIVICIKAIGDNFEEWHASEEQKIVSTIKILEKAVNQLEREETMIRHVTSDLHAALVCHKLIALPNMTRETVEKALSTDVKLMKKIRTDLGHGAELFLCSDELPPKNQVIWDYEDQNLWKNMMNWWQNAQELFIRHKNCGMESKIYRQLIGRYCGLLSTIEVWSPTNPRVEVRSESEVVNECAERFCKMVLLPHQIEALCSNHRRMFLYGPPGSGKTLVLILKAREWLLAGEKVMLVNARPGSPHGFPYAYGILKRLHQMMKDSKVPSYKLHMITIDSLRFKADDLAGIMPSYCIIMDEVTAASHEIIEHLSCLQVKNIWCAGLFIDDKPITALSFSVHKMDKILRCPPIVQSLLKDTEKEVKFMTPYRNIYQSSVLTRNWIIQRNGSTFKDGRNYVAENSRSISPTESEFSKKSSQLQDKENYVLGKEQMTALAPEQVLYGERQNVERDVSKEAHKNDIDSLNKKLFLNYDSDHHTSEELQNTNHLEGIDISEKSSVKNRSLHGVSNGEKIKKEFINLLYHFKNPNSENKPIVKNDTSTKSFEYYSETLDKSLLKKYHSRNEIDEEVEDSIQLQTTELEKSSTKNNSLDVSDNKRSLEIFEESIGDHTDSVIERLSIEHVSRPQVCEELQDTIPIKITDLYSEKPLIPNETCKDVLYDPESLDKRLQEKYNGMPQIIEESQSVGQIEFIQPSSYSSNIEFSLPTDGPRPHIIDHRSHSEPGNPADCFKCGYELAKFLESMIRPNDVSAFTSRHHQGQNKTKFGYKFVLPNRRSGKTDDTVVFSNTSSAHTKLSPFSFGQKLHASFDGRALTWSHVLIVAREMPKDCNFVTALRSRHIPLEILMSGSTSEIELNNERKLFITSYKEVTGMERALIVFFPSDSPDQLQHNLSTTNVPDLHLGHSINRFTEEDRRALWYVASRSLASLVLILP